MFALLSLLACGFVAWRLMGAPSRSDVVMAWYSVQSSWGASWGASWGGAGKTAGQVGSEDACVEQQRSRDDERSVAVAVQHATAVEPYVQAFLAALEPGERLVTLRVSARKAAPQTVMFSAETVTTVEDMIVRRDWVVRRGVDGVLRRVLMEMAVL